MSFVLTLVASNPDYPVTDPHIDQALGALKNQNIYPTCTPVWLQQDRAVDLGIDPCPDRARATRFRALRGDPRAADAGRPARWPLHASFRGGPDPSLRAADRRSRIASHPPRPVRGEGPGPDASRRRARAPGVFDRSTPWPLTLSHARTMPDGGAARCRFATRRHLTESSLRGG